VVVVVVVVVGRCVVVGASDVVVVELVVVETTLATVVAGSVGATEELVGVLAAGASPPPLHAASAASEAIDIAIKDRCRPFIGRNTTDRVRHNPSTDVYGRCNRQEIVKVTSSGTDNTVCVRLPDLPLLASYPSPALRHLT
jgi:hypothetical protein